VAFRLPQPLPLLVAGLARARFGLVRRLAESVRFPVQKPEGLLALVLARELLAPAGHRRVDMERRQAAPLPEPRLPLGEGVPLGKALRQEAGLALAQVRLEQTDRRRGVRLGKRVPCQVLGRLARQRCLRLAGQRLAAVRSVPLVASLEPQAEERLVSRSCLPLEAQQLVAVVEPLARKHLRLAVEALALVRVVPLASKNQCLPLAVLLVAPPAECLERTGLLRTDLQRRVARVPCRCSSRCSSMH